LTALIPLPETDIHLLKPIKLIIYQ
jgi:hypothetical protein